MFARACKEHEMLAMSHHVKPKTLRIYQAIKTCEDPETGTYPQEKKFRTSLGSARIPTMAVSMAS
jgi:hypothetical protein